MYHVESRIAWSICDDQGIEHICVTEHSYADFLCGLLNAGVPLDKVRNRPTPDLEYAKYLQEFQHSRDSRCSRPLVIDQMRAGLYRTEENPLMPFPKDPIGWLRREALTIYLTAHMETDFDEAIAQNILNEHPSTWGLEVVTCGLRKLNSLIGWSSSRYNECKKEEAVVAIQFMVEQGRADLKTFRSGCYSESAHTKKSNCQWTGGTYTLVVNGGIGLLYCGASDVSVTGEAVLLLPPKMPVVYTGAVIIQLNTECFITPTGKYQVLQEYARYYLIDDNGREAQVPKRNCSVLESMKYSADRVGWQDNSAQLSGDNEKKTNLFR